MANTPPLTNLPLDVPDSSSRDPSPGSEQSGRSKGSIRVSLACVPCRSKHIKCDATMPTCQRCQLEQKPCFYAKSRRGIRDPKKRSMISEGQPSIDLRENIWPLPTMSMFQVPIRLVDDAPVGWNLGSRIPQTASPAEAIAALLNSYYNNFYHGHPWTLPKQFMIAGVSTAPEELHFLISVFCFVGSLFESSISSDELREAAYSQALGPLPMTPFSVQGLLILSTVAFGEDKAELSSGWLDRAIKMALDIGMQHKTFADSELDLVVAESHRRTYWALYMHDCLRALRDNLPAFSLFAIPASTDIPCEEWEYQSGMIPLPVSLAQFDSRDLTDEASFSSWAYTIDLLRIVGAALLSLKLYHNRPWQEALQGAETKIVNWLLRVPKWKQDLLSPSGIADLIFYFGIGIAYTIRIRLRQPFNRLQAGLKEGFTVGPLERPTVSTSPKPTRQWSHCPAELHAVHALCCMFTYPLSPSQIGPSFIIVSEFMALGLLDACAFMGCDSPAVRERLTFTFGVLKNYAEVWPLARRILGTASEIARAVLPPAPVPTPGMHAQAQSPGLQSGNQSWHGSFFEGFGSNYGPGVAGGADLPDMTQGYYPDMGEGFGDWPAGE